MKRTLVIALIAALGAGAHAQVIFSGSPLSETFDTLASSGTANPWANNSTLTGWNIATTLSSITTYRSDNGSDTNGGMHSYGATGTSERAMGFIASNAYAASGSKAIFFGAQVVNNASGAVDSFTLQYNGEQWRQNGNQNAQKLIFEYSLNATSINDVAATWVAVTSLDFTGPVVGSSGAAIDGNTTGRVAVNSGAIAENLASNWNVGNSLWIRWTDTNDSSNDHGLAIDDVRLSANVVPEPFSMIAGLGAAAALVRRRKR